MLFARYAFPPNELGYCGPDGARLLLQHAASGGRDVEIGAGPGSSTGAWPTCECSRRRRDRRPDGRPGGRGVLDRQRAARHGSTPATCRRGCGSGSPARSGGDLATRGADGQAAAHHGFHVFAVYPWVGLLRTGSDVPRSVLDQCRIRWGTVVGVDGERRWSARGR